MMSGDHILNQHFGFTMKPENAVHLVQDLVDAQPYLRNWVVICKNLSTIALCDEKRRNILLSYNHVLLNDEERISLWGKHEIAHALVGNVNEHNVIWQRQAISLGIPPLPYDSEAVCPGRYKAVCPKCCRVFYKMKLPVNRINWCLNCGKTEGRLTYHEDVVVGSY